MRKRKVLQAIKYSSLNSFKYKRIQFGFYSINEKRNEKITSTRQVWKGGIKRFLVADVSNLMLNPNADILIAHLMESKIYFHENILRMLGWLGVVLRVNNAGLNITLIAFFILIGMFDASNQIWEKLLMTTTRN